MQKFTFTLLLLAILSFFSCSKKNLQLPKIGLKGITKIYNHSSIWIFYKVDGKDTIAVLNKNNKILNTNWIFNIDKRLNMNKITPLLTDLQLDKEKPSMHKIKGTINYFSYADIKNKNISLLNFKPTKFIYSYEQFKNNLENNAPTFKTLILNIQNQNLFIGTEKVETNSLLSQLQEIQKKDTLQAYKIFIKCQYNTSYQNYLKTKVFLSKIDMEIDSTEYIYNNSYIYKN